MNDKFTIRDFFAYFLSGCYFYMAIFFSNFETINAFLLNEKENLKDHSTLLIFIALPFIYLTLNSPEIS
jgi:uncharacterized protein (UPF0332 family)